MQKENTKNKRNAQKIIKTIVGIVVAIIVVLFCFHYFVGFGKKEVYKGVSFRSSNSTRSYECDDDNKAKIELRSGNVAVIDVEVATTMAEIDLRGRGTWSDEGLKNGRQMYTLHIDGMTFSVAVAENIMYLTGLPIIVTLEKV